MPESVEEKLVRNVLISGVSGFLLTVVLYLIRCLRRGEFHPVTNVRYLATFAFATGGSYFLLTVIEDRLARRRNRKIARRAKEQTRQQSQIDWSANLQSPRSSKEPPAATPPEHPNDHV